MFENFRIPFLGRQSTPTTSTLEEQPDIELLMADYRKTLLRQEAEKLVYGRAPAVQEPYSGQTYDWVVIGGGPQGMHIANVLANKLGFGTKNICIIDPNPSLLHMWRSRASSTGMRNMRSNWSHHLGVRKDCLEAFGAQHGERVGSPPSLALFNDHCEWLTRQFLLTDCHLQAYVTRMEIAGRDDVRLETTAGPVRSRRVMLALGPGEDLWPDWCTRMKHHNPNSVAHVFSRPRVRPDARVAIVGGGLTGAQTAINHWLMGHKVTLVAKSSFVASDYDASNEWMFGNRKINSFRTLSTDERLAEISGNRQRGTVPGPVKEVMDDLVSRGEIKLILDPEPYVHYYPNSPSIEVEDSEVDMVLVCTGFAKKRPGGALVDNLINEHGIVERSGFPILWDDLSFDGLPVYACGMLAQLQLGPPAGSFRGAQLAGDRLLEHLS